jgi:predicted amidohydrolase YtcJ
METDPATPELVARLRMRFPRFGDDLLRSSASASSRRARARSSAKRRRPWRAGTRRVAEAGWRNENHSLTPTDFKVIIDGWERLHASLPGPGIAELRWVLAHAPFITREYADKLAALGGGVSVLGGWRYISGTAQQNGPPFRMLARQRHPDGHELRRHADLADEPVARPLLRRHRQERARRADQRGANAERGAALRLYTAANGWFLNEEDMLGTLEPGKYADVAVLSADYFDADDVPDEAIKRIGSVLTLVGGEVVFGDPAASAGSMRSSTPGF